MDTEKLAEAEWDVFIDGLSPPERNFVAGVDMAKNLMLRAMLHGIGSGLDIAKAVCVEGCNEKKED